MSDETRPGLIIRRKADTPKAARAVTTKGDDPLDEEPVPDDTAADADPAPTPAADTRVAKAAADGGQRKDRVWRSDSAPKAGPTDDEEPETVRELRDQPMPTTDDFAAMLGDAPLHIAHHEVGDKVEADIVSIGDDTLFVSLGGKSEGVISKAAFLDDEGLLTVGIGDPIEAYIVSMRGGDIRLSVALGSGPGDGAMLEDAMAQQIPVEGRVTSTNKGGFDVDVIGTRGFCPFSQIDVDGGVEPEAYLGETYRFLVTRIEEDGRNVVLSRAALIRRDRETAAEETLRELELGAELDGVVTRLADFGAFIDIGGVDGLVHISELSWDRVEHPSELVAVGDRVRVAVLAMSNLDDPQRRRIGLSMKALAEDPWVATIKSLQVGDTTAGRVVRLERYGAFVEIAPGVDGLVHVSEISEGRRIHHPREVLAVGDKVHAQVLRIDPQKRQIALSLKALMDDPWVAAASELSIGSMVQGQVDSVQGFGVFIELASGINGLIPLSQLEDDEQRNVHNRFRTGTAVEARVIAIDPERHRLTLSRRQDTEAEARAAYDTYKSAGAESSGGGSFGTFADLLKKRGT